MMLVLNKKIRTLTLAPTLSPQQKDLKHVDQTLQNTFLIR